MAKKKTVQKLDPTRAVVYVRVSTDEQHLGPEAQAESCRVYAARMGLTVCDTFSDIGVSGAAPLHECDGLQAAIECLKVHNAGVLLIAKRDRLARDVLKAGMVTQRVEANGARVVSADGVPESDEPTAVLLRQIIDAFSQFERALIIARTTAALQAKKRKGELTGKVPRGFKRDGKKLVLDEVQVAEHRAVKARAQAILDNDGSLQDVLNVFKAENVKYRNIQWSHRKQIQRILDLDL